MENSKTCTVAIYLDANAPFALAFEGPGSARLPAYQWVRRAENAWIGISEVPRLEGGKDKAQLYVVDADHVLKESAEIKVRFPNGSPFGNAPAPDLVHKKDDPDAPGMKGQTPPQTWVSTPTKVADPNSETRYSFTIEVTGDEACGSEDLVFYLDPEMVVEPGG